MHVNIFWDDVLSADLSTVGANSSYKPCLIAGVGLDGYFSLKGQEDGFLAIFKGCDLSESVYFLNGHYYSSEVWAEMKQCKDDSVVWKSPDGLVLGWKSCIDPEECRTERIVDYTYEPLVHSWDALNAHERMMAMMDVSRIDGIVMEGAHLLGEVELGEGSQILPGVVIEGHVRIGKGCKIGPNCYLRGEVSIGDRCVIGQSVEVKNSMIGHDTFISHLSYIGDSILGNNVNIGGGTIISNYRHDGKEHLMMTADGELLPTGRIKLGAFLEDGVRCGANSVVLPGRRMKEGRWSMPGEIVKK